MLKLQTFSAKPKLHRWKANHSLPTLELLAVYLALKCLLNLLGNLKRSSVIKLTIAMDSQIVLSWILNESVKTKNIFAANRIKDIVEFQRTLLEQHNLTCTFRYVQTDKNPADLLTRGITVRGLENLPYLESWPSISWINDHLPRPSAL